MSGIVVVDRRRVDTLGNARVQDEAMGERCGRVMFGHRCESRGEHRWCWFNLDPGGGVRVVIDDRPRGEV